MEDEVANDGRILEQEADNEDLWWDRLFDLRCPRCGSSDTYPADYIQIDDDEFGIGTTCESCRYDSEYGGVPPERKRDEGRIVVTGLEAGKSYQITVEIVAGTSRLAAVTELLKPYGQGGCEPPVLKWEG